MTGRSGSLIISVTGRSGSLFADYPTILRGSLSLTLFGIRNRFSLWSSARLYSRGTGISMPGTWNLRTGCWILDV